MAVLRLVVLLSLFCGAFCQSEIETEIANALSSWAESQKEDTVRLNDAISKLVKQLDENNTDWSNTGVVIGDVDNEDDDVINLQLAENELVGKCSHGDCKFCKGWKHVKFCFEAKLLKLGFEIKVMANDHVLYDKTISAANPPPLCVGTKLVGKVCVEIYNVNISNKSACVRVTFQVKIGPFKKKVKLNIKCFKFGHGEDTSLSFVKLVQQLADRQTNNVL